MDLNDLNVAQDVLLVLLILGISVAVGGVLCWVLSMLGLVALIV